MSEALGRLGLLHLEDKPEELRAELQNRIKENKEERLKKKQEHIAQLKARGIIYKEAVEDHLGSAVKPKSPERLQEYEAWLLTPAGQEYLAKKI